MEINAKKKRAVFVFTDVDIDISKYDCCYVIGAECTHMIEKCRRENKTCYICNDYIDISTFQEGYSYLDVLEDDIVKDLANLLNEYHKTYYTYDQWRIVLGRWVQMYVESLYIKYLKMQSVRDILKNQDVSIAGVDGDEWAVPIDYRDYSQMLDDDVYNLQQYVFLIKNMLNLEVEVFDIQFNHEVDNMPYKKRTVRLMQGYIGILKRFIGRDEKKPMILINDSYIPYKQLLLDYVPRARGRIGIVYGDYTNSDRKNLEMLELDSAFRDYMIKPDNSETVFAKTIYEWVLKCLPKAYVEGFDYVLKKADQYFGYAQNVDRIFYSNSGIDEDEVFKAYLQKQKEKGSLFCNIQHGGEYGIEKTRGSDFEYKIADCMYTWGWELGDVGRTKFCPMPATKLMHDRYSHNRITNEYSLVVDYTYFKYGKIYSFRSFNLKNNIDGQLEFLSRLDENVRKDLLYRPFHEDVGMGLKQRIQRTFPDVRMDEETSFIDSLKKSKLVILTELSTTWIEAIALSKPIIVRMDMSNIEKDALEDIKELKNCGIVVETWEELAERVNEASIDIETWWNYPQRQSVVKYIKNKYSYQPPNSKAIWRKHLLDICNGK